MQQGYYIKLSNDQRDRLLSQDFDIRVETLRSYVAEDALKVREDVEETNPSAVRFQLNFGCLSPDGISETCSSILRELDGAAYFGDYSDNSALCELIAECERGSQGRFLQSVSWTINSIDERDALSMPLRDFVIGAVQSNGYHCDGNIVLGIQPTSASVNGFDAFNLKFTQYVSTPSRGANNG